MKRHICPFVHTYTKKDFFASKQIYKSQNWTVKGNKTETKSY